MIVLNKDRKVGGPDGAECKIRFWRGLWSLFGSNETSLETSLGQLRTDAFGPELVQAGAV